MDTAAKKVCIVNEAGTLDGTLQQIDCSGVRAVLWLRSLDGKPYQCLIKKELAAGLAMHDRMIPIRLSGQGDWRRDAGGEWELTQFQVGSWEPLATESALEIMDVARNIDGNGWNLLQHPITEHQRLREAE
jgi:hypothetical protein